MPNRIIMNASLQKKIGVILQYSQMALSILISFIYTPTMLRILGQAEYGLYSLSSSIISYLSLLSLGFGTSYIRFYSRYKKDDDDIHIKKLNGLFLIVFLTMGTIAMTAGLSLSGNVGVFFNETYSDEDLHIARVLMIFMTFNLALSFPTSVFTSYVTSQERFVFQKLLNMIKTVFSPLVTLPILFMGYGSIGMVVVTTVITVFVDLSNVIFCLKKLDMRFDFCSPDLHLLKEIAGFSFFIALNQIVDQINWATDRVVLGKLCTSAAVAVYSVGAQINNYYLQFSTAISGVFVPQVNRIVASDTKEDDKNKQLTELFTKVGRVQFMVLMLVLTGFIFFGKFFMVEWAGAGYERSYYVTLLLIVPVTIPLVQNIGIEIQRAKNKHKFRSYVYLGMALLNVVISIFFASMWGEIGAALGTTISLIVANGFVMNWFYHKKLELDMMYFWKEISKFLPSLILPIVAGIVLNIRPTTSLMAFGFKVVIYSVVYCISVYFLGMNPFEKGQATKMFKKRKRYDQDLDWETEVDVMDESKVLHTYAAYSLENAERMNSSSGGIFSLLAKEILNDCGVVYGVAMSEDCNRAEFIRVREEAQLARLRTSKYLQAEVGNAFSCARTDLEQGIPVLFSGTGCQINGFIGYLGRGQGREAVYAKYPNLYCVDCVCHGVPSPALWRQYVSYVEEQNQAKLEGVNFRCKDDSWTDFGMKELHQTANPKNGTQKQKAVYISKDKDPYMQMFLRDYCLRPSCYQCKAKKIKLADITLADFWGIKQLHPDMTDGKGTSLVLIRTERGKELFQKIAGSLRWKEVSYQEGVSINKAEYLSASRPEQRDVFFTDMNTMPFSALKEKYGAPMQIPMKRKIKSSIKKILLKTKILPGGDIDNPEYGIMFVLCPEDVLNDK